MDLSIPLRKMLIPSWFDLSAYLSFLLSLPLSMHCSEMLIPSTFDLSIYLGMPQWIAASRREEEEAEAERKEGKEGNEKQLLIPVLKPN